MHNICQAGDEFTMKEIEDLFFRQTKLACPKPARRW
jgi:hypothetical protein